jgi:protein involved in polysaccharide export with SLBB domain
MQQFILRMIFAAFCSGSLLALAGCTSNGPAGFVSYSQEGESAQARVPLRNPAGPYTVRTNDQLRVQVYNEPTISGDYVVDGTGFLSVPVAGRVRAGGLTVEQLERKVTAQLNSGILKDARVSIQITSYAPFYIRGEVKKPGEFPYKPNMTVGDAVALAGGYTYRADESKAYVRPVDAAAEVVRSLGTDQPVSPGDNIRIPERFL